jgi:sugar-specific transcriptional regulator TrmB
VSLLTRNRKTQINKSFSFSKNRVSGETILVKHEDIHILKKLGLTGSQARVYLALVNHYKTNAKTLWKASKVARQDIYRILTELREIGILEKILEAPTEFKAVPIEDTVAILFERKAKAIFSLQKDADKLIQKFKENGQKIKPEKETQYVLVPEREAITRRLKQAIENSKESIGAISSVKAFARSAFVLSEEIEKAMRKGIKIQWIIDEPGDANPLPEALKNLTENPNFELKTVLDPPNVRLGIYDKKEVFMASFPNRDALESPVLWSTNSSFAEIVQGFFETIWHVAVKYKLKKTKCT